MGQTATSIAADPIQAVAMRVSALQVSGAPLAGANHGYCTQNLVDIDVKPDVEKGADFVKKNAQNNICQEYRDCDRLKSFDITITFCAFEPDLVQMLIGGVTVANAGKTQGGQLPLPTDTCGNGYCLEFWQLLWDGDQQIAPTGYGFAPNTPGYLHWVFPRCFGQISDFKMQADFTDIKIDVVARINNAMNAHGPFEDWQSPIVSFGGIKGLAGYMIDGAVPATQVGLVSVPSVGS